ncbi:unnamed protein product [marine sediment metagenome]|uniref:MYM-type domain-containing protein n=1 Tax=marine sediment metagenome TaxID=412755 RepID=X1D8N6_9ZZZZ
MEIQYNTVYKAKGDGKVKCEKCKKSIKKMSIILTYSYSPFDLNHGDGRYFFCSNGCLKEWLA